MAEIALTDRYFSDSLMQSCFMQWIMARSPVGAIFSIAQVYVVIGKHREDEPLSICCVDSASRRRYPVFSLFLLVSPVSGCLFRIIMLSE